MPPLRFVGRGPVETKVATASRPVTEERAERRLFVGIALEPAAAPAVDAIAARLRDMGLRGRYVGAEDFHVTLAFLGGVPDARVDALGAALEPVAAAAAPFRLRFDRLGAFPDRGRPRVAWLGAERVPDAFGALGAAVREACARLEYASREDLHVHLTLCRPDPGQRLPALEFAPIESAVRELALFESAAGRPRYRLLVRHALGAARAGAR